MNDKLQPATATGEILTVPTTRRSPVTIKKAIIGAVILALLAGGAYFYFVGAATTPVEAPVTAAEPVIASNAVVAEAKVVPARSAALSLPASGTVAEVLVAEGAKVKAGQVIARLDTAAQQAVIAQNEARLRKSEADLADLLDGPQPEDIAAAEAGLRQAQAQLRLTLGSVSPIDIQAAQASIQAAQAVIAQLKAGNNPEVRAAQATLNQAQAALESQRNQLSSGKSDADLRLQQASERLIQAQTAYSLAKWNWQHVQDVGTDPYNPQVADEKNPGKTKGNKLNEAQKQQYHDAFTQAEAELRSAEAGVQQAQVAADSSRKGEITGLTSAEQSLVSAQANLDQVTSGITTERLASAKAQLANAQATLSKLSGAKRDDEIALAQAGVDAAQANLVKLKAGPQQSTLQAMQAQADSDKAALEAAKVELARMELKAPFDGVVAGLDIRPNEFVTAGATIVRMADTVAWQIETTDLTELNVAKTYEGAPATITFDALPGLTLPGTVTQIKGFGENKQGDITYTVVVKPNQQDARMRWNMTASVSIDAK
jgi:HlyD family secretion protein